jgi:hypothetical protein
MNQHLKFTAGGIGHRDLTNTDEILFVRFFLYQLLNELAAQIFNARAVSALAYGADTIFAECARQLSIPLEAVIAFKSFESDFKNLEQYTRYRRVRDGAVSETSLDFGQRCWSAYKRSMELVVFRSNLVIAVWDGKCMGSVGGTWEAIALCDSMGKPVLHIDTQKRSVFLRICGASTEGSPRRLVIDALRGRH